MASFCHGLTAMSFSQSWALSQRANKASGECSVCHAVRQLHHKDGAVHQHGPRSNPCPGSNQLPVVTAAGTSNAIPAPTNSQPAYSNSRPLRSARLAASQDPSSPNTASTPGPADSNSQQTADVLPMYDHPQLQGGVVKHIPRSARPHCAGQLITAIHKILADPDNPRNWTSLLDYGRLLLLIPIRSGRKHNIASVIKKRSIDEPTGTSPPTRPLQARQPRHDNTTLAAAVRAKLEDGNIKAAVRIISSEEKPAPDDAAKLNSLRQTPAITARSPTSTRTFHLRRRSGDRNRRHQSDSVVSSWLICWP